MFIWFENYIINKNAVEYVGKVYGEKGNEKFTIYLNSGREITIYQDPRYNSKKVEEIHDYLYARLCT